MNKMELLAPAGSYDSFLAAINAGADAIYAAGEQFGARAYAENFTQLQLLRALDYAHLHGKKLYLALNTLLKKNELETQLDAFVRPFYEAGLDGIIVQDVGVFSHIKTCYPKLPLHISTQMTVTGTDGARFWKEQGAQRIVPARELSLSEIAAMKQESGLEIEVFVHGALCYCYSGQCFFSSLLGGRSGNRGRCAQPCRLPYTVNGVSGHFLSPKDLCALKLLPQLAGAGVDSLKIEGRMKSPSYTAGVVTMYRKYLDLLYTDPGAWSVEPADFKTLEDLYNRGGASTDGYFFRHNAGSMIAFRQANYRTKQNDDALSAKCTEQPAILLDGMVSLYKDTPASLSLWTKDSSITVEGDIVQQAKNQPLTREGVCTQLNKTGGTPYQLQTLYCEMDADVFLPKQALNKLRRDALDAIQEKLLAPYRRFLPDNPNAAAKPDTAALQAEHAIRIHQKSAAQPTASCLLVASVESDAQLDAALHCPSVARIDLDTSLVSDAGVLSQKLAEACSRKAKAAGKALFLRFPPVFRQTRHTDFEHALHWISDCFTGIVVRNVDAYAFAVHHRLFAHMQVVCDFTVYAFQQAAGDFWRQYPTALTAPIELNHRELIQNDGLYEELIVYGRYPMMVSAGCISRTLCHQTSGRESCNPKDSVLYLIDRYNKRFPVRHVCGDCYNIIYNSVPLSLLEEGQLIRKTGIRTLRLLFTTEDRAQTAAVLDCFCSTFLSEEHVNTRNKNKAPLFEATKGHFKRGAD